MVELESRVETRDGVALVELVVRNPTATARRVRVGNRLDGSVWPPRREGVPAAGWDDGGFEGVVAAEGRRALGYASPVSSGESAAEPPVEIVWSERAGDSESPDHDVTPEGVVRSLGDHRPPADAVPAPRSGTSETDPGSVRDSETARNPGTDSESAIPDSVEAWLTTVEERADGNLASPEPTPEDWRALGAVARRIERLRSETDDSRGSRSP